MCTTGGTESFEARHLGMDGGGLAFDFDLQLFADYYILDFSKDSLPADGYCYYDTGSGPSWVNPGTVTNINPSNAYASYVVGMLFLSSNRVILTGNDAGISVNKGNATISDVYIGSSDNCVRLGLDGFSNFTVRGTTITTVTGGCTITKGAVAVAKSALAGGHVRMGSGTGNGWLIGSGTGTDVIIDAANRTISPVQGSSGTIEVQLTEPVDSSAPLTANGVRFFGSSVSADTPTRITVAADKTVTIANLQPLSDYEASNPGVGFVLAKGESLTVNGISYRAAEDTNLVLCQEGIYTGKLVLDKNHRTYTAANGQKFAVDASSSGSMNLTIADGVAAVTGLASGAKFTLEQGKEKYTCSLSGQILTIDKGSVTKKGIWGTSLDTKNMAKLFASMDDVVYEPKNSAVTLAKTAGDLLVNGSKAGRWNGRTLNLTKNLSGCTFRLSGVKDIAITGGKSCKLAGAWTMGGVTAKSASATYNGKSLTLTAGSVTLAQGKSIATSKGTVTAKKGSFNVSSAGAVTGIGGGESFSVSVGKKTYTYAVNTKNKTIAVTGAAKATIKYLDLAKVTFNAGSTGNGAYGLAGLYDNLPANATYDKTKKTITLKAAFKGSINLSRYAPSVQTVDGSATAKGLTLTGTSAANTLKGGKGNDTLNGNAGANKLYGNGGNDKLIGGSGNDSLYGGAGNDILKGGAGTDILRGGAGTDTIVCGKGVDKIQFYKGEGKDTIQGGDKNDILYLSNIQNIKSQAKFKMSGKNLVMSFTTNKNDTITLTNWTTSGLNKFVVGGKTYSLKKSGNTVSVK